MLDVVEVILEFDDSVLFGGRVAVFDQRPSGHARPDGVAHSVEGDLPGQFLHELRPLRPGTHRAHLPLEDVDKLRELVYMGLAQDAADLKVIQWRIYRLLLGHWHRGA